MRSTRTSLIRQTRFDERMRYLVLQADERSQLQFQVFSPVCSIQQAHHREPQTATRATYIHA
jgi:hypothetical protein